MIEFFEFQTGEWSKANTKTLKELVKCELENFILWYWSDDKNRERPLKALEQYDKDDNYNEID